MKERSDILLYIKQGIKYQNFKNMIGIYIAFNINFCLATTKMPTMSLEV